MCEERFGASKTPFSGAFTSSTPVLYAVIAIGLVLFACLVLDDVVEGLSR